MLLISSIRNLVNLFLRLQGEVDMNIENIFKKYESLPKILTRSYYSFYKSSLNVNDLVKYSIKDKNNVTILCDYNNFYGLWEFLNSAKVYGLKPVIGVQITDNLKEGGILIFFKDWEVRKIVFKILTERNYIGRIPYEYIAKLSKEKNGNLEKVIIIALNKKEYLKLRQIFGSDYSNLYLGIFDYTFYKLSTSKKFTDQWLKVFNKVSKASNPFNIDNDYKIKDDFKIKKEDLIFISRFFYSETEDIEFIKILNNINGDYGNLGNKQLIKHNFKKGYLNNDAMYYARYHKIDSNYIKKLFNPYNDLINQYLEASINNLITFIENIDIKWEKNDFFFPDFYKKEKKRMDFINNENLDNSKLKEIVLKLLPQFYSNDNIKKAKDRFLFEFEIIKKKKFSSYFLFVYSMLKYAKKKKISFIGRGSAVSSIISYILGISEVDPIKYNLYFERFINPVRASPPDIDIDFSWKQRDRVLKYLYDKYNNNSSKNNTNSKNDKNVNKYKICNETKKRFVAMISTHLHFSYRRSFREVAKFYGLPDEFISIITKNIPHHFIRTSLKDVIEQINQKILENVDTELLNKIIKYSIKLKGFPFAIGVHPGGFCISDTYKKDEITNYTPIELAPKGLAVTQFDMYSIENTGLIKIDILSQRALGVLDDILKNIEQQYVLYKSNDFKEKKNLISFMQKTLENYRVNKSFDKISIFYDKETWKMIAKGDTIGCFYIESPGMRGLLKSLHCDNFELLVAASSVIRPGVSESGMKNKYIYYHRNPDKVKYIIPELEKILPDTYGIMIYQEDVMKIATQIGGLSLAEADVLRRGMSGKSRSKAEIEKLKKNFFKNALRKGINQKYINILWNQIESFAGYAFCKAHSASYAILSVKLAYLKRHFPSYFFAAVINNYGGYYPTAVYIFMAIINGIVIKKPDISFSTKSIKVIDNKIYLGLDMYSFLNKVQINKISKNSPFKSLTSFILSTKIEKSKILKLFDLNFFHSLYNDNGLIYILIHSLYETIKEYGVSLKQKDSGKNYKICKTDGNNKSDKNSKDKNNKKNNKSDNCKKNIYRILLNIEQFIVKEWEKNKKNNDEDNNKNYNNNKINNENNNNNNNNNKNKNKINNDNNKNNKNFYNTLYYEFKYFGSFISVNPVDIIFKLVKDYEDGNLQTGSLVDAEELDGIYKQLKKIISSKILSNVSTNIDKLIDKNVSCFGYYIIGRSAVTKQKKMMGFATFIDKEGVFEATLFPDQYSKYYPLFKYFKYFIIKGKVSNNSGAYSIEVEQIIPFFTNFLYILKKI